VTVEDRLRAVIAEHPGPLYQTHTWAGVELNSGIRGVERRALLDLRARDAFTTDLPGLAEPEES
jgi:hypothetical protein